MLFDFDTFTQLVTRAYEGGSFTLGQVLYVFKYYFSRYEAVMGHPHPHIRMNQIRRIVKEMPYLNDQWETISIEPEWYPEMIDKHFKTKYRNCDYNINHFFSGRIRELRFYDGALRG